jgi:hypothetical protein
MITKIKFPMDFDRGEDLYTVIISAEFNKHNCATLK